MLCRLSARLRRCFGWVLPVVLVAVGLHLWAGCPRIDPIKGMHLGGCALGRADTVLARVLFGHHVWFPFIGPNRFREGHFSERFIRTPLLHRFGLIGSAGQRAPAGRGKTCGTPSVRADPTSSASQAWELWTYWLAGGRVDISTALGDDKVQKASTVSRLSLAMPMGSVAVPATCPIGSSTRMASSRRPTGFTITKALRIGASPSSPFLITNEEKEWHKSHRAGQ